MNIHAYVMAHNEAETIALTIRHYYSFCSHVVLLDNFSDDGTPDIARQMHCKVIQFGKQGLLDDEIYRQTKNEIWKKNHPGSERRDFVIVCDADEVLKVSFAQLRAAEKENATIFNTWGFDVFSYEMPEYEWFEILTGHHQPNYNKTVIFNPKFITDINFRIGAHTSSPKGIVKWASERLPLFHYRNVGGPERLVKRHAMYRPRMSEENKIRNFGIHYTWDDDTRIKEWEEKYSMSKLFSGVPPYS